MLSIIEAAGWPIWLIIVTSVVALAIIGERFWSLRGSVVAPREVLPATIREYQAKGVSQDLINRLQRGPGGNALSKRPTRGFRLSYAPHS